MRSSTENPADGMLVRRAIEEMAALRSELRTRILLQNVLLMICTVGFGAIAAAVAIGDRPVELAFAYAVFDAALSLQWCHHGVRTKQLKQYLVQQETERGESWERWLPANRPASWLGSRWFVSTKGVFIGTQLAMLILCLAAAGPQGIVMPLFVATLPVVGLTAWFLLTNPKE